MLQLELEDQQAVLMAFVPDMAKRGGPVKEPVTFLKISTVQDSDILSEFEPTLEAFYFDKDGPQDIGGGAPLRDPHMVFPHKRNEEMSGAHVKIGFGVGNPMEFPDAVLDEFHLEPKSGGRVIIGFRVRVYPDEAQVGKLYMLQEQRISVSVQPMDLPTMREAA